MRNAGIGDVFILQTLLHFMLGGWGAQNQTQGSGVWMLEASEVGRMWVLQQFPHPV